MRGHRSTPAPTERVAIAKAVQAALEAQGIPHDRTVLEKPAETSGTAATNAASRRVEVVVRK